jgi:ammonium transporter Rh
MVWIFFRVLEGGFAGAAVLISFGVVLGKTNPLQLLVMAIIETALYVANILIGTHLLLAVDIGKMLLLSV